MDGARLPLYLWSEGTRLLTIWPTIAGLTLATVAGTIAGRRVLSRIPERVFHRIISAVVLLLGAYMLVRASMGDAG